LRVFNRVLMSLHVALVILSVAGAIELALTYRYTNPYEFSPPEKQRNVIMIAQWNTGANYFSVRQVAHD
jgi:hypothetical protein